jgi:hypothetical protein
METQSIHSSAEVHKAVLHSMGVRAADSNSRCMSMDADGESSPWHSQLSLQLFTYLCLYPINGPMIAMIKELMVFGTWF